MEFFGKGLSLGALLCLLCSPAAAGAADLSVRVLDPSGQPIPAAVVVGVDEAGVEGARASTSREGVAVLESGPVAVSVQAEGFQESTVPFSGRREIAVTLQIATRQDRLDIVGEALSVPVAGQAVETPAVLQADLVESLRAVPNVSVLRRGGTNLDPVVQGLRETQVAMVVDGTRTFAAGPARMDSELSHVDVGNVGSIEVITGPYALAEGAGAMAAILVHSPTVSRSSGWRMGGRAGLGMRSNGAGRAGHARLDATGASLGFSLRASGDLSGDYSAGARAGSSTVVPADATAHQIGGQVWYSPTSSQELLLAGFYDEQTGVDYPGRLLTAEHFLLRHFRASYRLERPDGLLSAVKLTAYSSRKSHRMSNRGKPTAMDMPGRRPPFALDVSLPTESDTVGGAGRVTLAPSRNWILQGGFDAFRLEQDAQRFIHRARDGRLMFSDAVWAGTSLSDVGTYFLAGRSFDRGEVRMAGRLDFVGADAGRPSAFFRDNAAQDLSRAETNANVSLAGRYELREGLTVSGGMGRVVRTANALERYSDRFPSTRFQVAAEFMGSPDLRPETSVQGDLGLEWRVGDYRLSALGFVRTLDGYITVAPDATLPKRLPLSPPVVFRYVNGESAWFRGWSVGIQRVGKALEIRSQLSKTVADDRELHEPMLGIPPAEVDSAVRYLAGSGVFWVEYGVRSAWSQRRVSRTRMETPSPGFTLHGLRLGAKLWREGTVLHLGVENLGDKHYFEHLNSLNPFTRQRIPEMGRVLVVGLSTTW